MVVTALFILPSIKETVLLNNSVQTSTNLSEVGRLTASQPEPNDESKTSKVQEVSEAQSALRLSREIELNATKSELDQLMLDYNDNLKNTEAKQKLKIKMAALIEKYNAQVLPIALDQIQKSDKSGS